MGTPRGPHLPGSHPWVPPTPHPHGSAPPLHLNPTARPRGATAVIIGISQYLWSGQLYPPPPLCPTAAALHPALIAAMAAVLAFLLLILLRMASPHGAPRCPGCGLTALTPPAQRRVLLAMAQHSILAWLHLPERPRAPHPPSRAALLSALRRLQPQLTPRGIAPPRPPNSAEQNYEVLSFAEAGG